MKQVLYTFIVFLFLIKANTINAQDWHLAGNADATSASKLGTTNTQPIRFFTKNLERMRLDTQGRFGVGTTAPQALFDVNSTSGFQVARFNNNQTKIYIGIYKSNNLKGYVGSYGGAANDVDFGTASTNPSGAVHLAVASVPKLTVNSTGLVGIGTTAPYRKLQIQDGDFRIQTTNAVQHYLEFTNVSPNTADWRFEHSFDGHSLFISTTFTDFASTSFTDKAYFDTAVYGYSFSVFGKARAYAWDIFSDRRLKNNIKDFKNATDIINKLQPKTYTFNSSAYASLHLPTQKQYGLIAQEVEQVLPELVTSSDVPLKDEASGERKMQELKSVNYSGLIPVLIKGIQEQNQKIEILEKQLSELKEMVSKLQNGTLQASTLSGARLEQNAPNPYYGTSVIRYNIPQSAGVAKILIKDAKGAMIKSISINSKGEGQVTLSSGSLAAGTYNYTLWVDNQVVDTKKMVIMK